MAAGLVGCGAGFPLWLRKVERRVVVAKAMVKWALAWSATSRAAGQEVGRFGVGVAAFLRRSKRLWRGWPMAVCPRWLLWGYATPSAPLLLRVFPGRGLAKALLPPLACCKMVVRLAGLGAGDVKAPWCAGQPAGVCLFRRWAAPNPACSGHGFAVGLPWWLVGRSNVACRVGWTAPPCR